MYHKPLVYGAPGMEAVEALRDVTYRSVQGTELKMDIYLPPRLSADARLPVVFFIHGGFIPRETTFLPKDWGVYQSYGRLAAASGMIGVTFNHRYWGWSREDMERSFGDVRAAIRFVRDRADSFHADASRAALWGFSGGGPHLGLAVQDGMEFVRCLVGFYAIFDLEPQVRSQSLDPEKEGTTEYSLMTHLSRSAGRFPPIFIGRAGLDAPAINTAVDAFAARALELNVMLDLANHPQGRHGFDILDDDLRSREIIARAIDFLKARLLPSASSPGAP
jgi:acetyl esterase/lipase